MAADPDQLSASTAAPPAKPPIWNDPAWRALFFQVVVVTFVIGIGGFLMLQTYRLTRERHAEVLEGIRKLTATSTGG